MIRDDNAYLKHILDSILFVEKYCGKLDIGRFRKDELLQSAVVRQLEIIGEAARLVSKETKAKLPAIQWNMIIGMRDKLIHEYFGVDLNVVWSTINEELPKLKAEIQRYFRNGK